MTTPRALPSAAPDDAGLGWCRRLVRRRPTTCFFALSCLLSWWAIIGYLTGVSPVPTASFGPFLAAVIVLGLGQGGGAVKRLLRSMVQWRAPLRCYGMALAIPTLISGLALAATVGAGGSVVPGSLTRWIDVPLTLLTVLLVPGLGGAWEEPGFRGYALGRLERLFGAVTGPLVLGVLWVVWHLPLFLVGQIEPTDVLVIVAASVVIAAIFHSAEDSVLIAMVVHATNNAVGGSYASQVFTGSDRWLLGAFTALGWWVAAAVVLARQRAASSQSSAAVVSR